MVNWSMLSCRGATLLHLLRLIKRQRWFENREGKEKRKKKERKKMIKTPLSSDTVSYRPLTRSANWVFFQYMLLALHTYLKKMLRLSFFVSTNSFIDGQIYLFASFLHIYIYMSFSLSFQLWHRQLLCCLLSDVLHFFLLWICRRCHASVAFCFFFPLSSIFKSIHFSSFTGTTPAYFYSSKTNEMELDPKEGAYNTDFRSVLRKEKKKNNNYYHNREEVGRGRGKSGNIPPMSVSFSLFFPFFLNLILLFFLTTICSNFV